MPVSSYVARLSESELHSPQILRRLCHSSHVRPLHPQASRRTSASDHCDVACKRRLLSPGPHGTRLAWGTGLFVGDAQISTIYSLAADALLFHEFPDVHPLSAIGLGGEFRRPIFPGCGKR